jgi:hypothetical protein
MLAGTTKLVLLFLTVTVMEAGVVFFSARPV